MKKATTQELKRIQDYLLARGIHATKDQVIDAALKVAKRLGAGDYTFFVELK